MKKIKLLSFLLIIFVGVFIFIYGGYDDSPGAQLMGLMVVIVGIGVLIKRRKK